VSEDHFLSRWSKRKHQANRGEPAPEPAPPVPPAPAPAVAENPVPAVPEPAPLPDVASLTPESDFTGFMREGVPEPLRREALKTLFQDPRFNVMDGLDVYIDDFSKPDPLPEGWLEKMNQVARLGEYREPDPEGAEPVEKKPIEDTSARPQEAGAKPLPEASNCGDGSRAASDPDAAGDDPPEVPES
jgi:hypothetical protein